jgi:glycosyltransferase involved in cell wall biosynthesis
VLRLVAGAPQQRRVVHGFYTWGIVGLEARRRAPGAGLVPLTSVYAVAAHETRTKLRGTRSPALRFMALAEWLWTATMVRGVERRVCRRSVRILVNYDSVRRQLRATYGPVAPVVRIPYSSDRAFLDGGVPARAPAPPATNGHPLRLVSVSRHDPRKGIEVLLRALAILRRRGVDVRTVVLSGGPLLERHRRLAGNLALENRVEFTGWVDDPATFLSDAEVFALPSLQEGSGSVALLEAMQAGLAIVASDVDGIPEDVRDGDNGLLVPPGEPAAMAAALERLWRDPDLRRRLAARARATYEECFSAAAFSAALGAQYRELLAVG